jgi:hypothetical protein
LIDKKLEKEIDIKNKKIEEKSYGKVRLSKDLVRDGKKFKLDGKLRKVVSFDGASYVKV